MKEPGLTQILRTETISEILLDHEVHTTAIFPDSPGKSCVLTANATADQWSAWTEITDSSAVTLSSKFASNTGHITAMAVETADEANVVFMTEVSYGADKTIVGRQRVLTETNKLPAVQAMQERGDLIPAGETIYSRTACEAAGAKTINIHFRYFLHS